MSRPIIPTFTVPGWTIPTWAPDAAYPSGANPWNGQPTKVVHAGASTVGFTPKQPVSAQAMNYLVNAAYDVDGEAKTHATTLTSEVQSFAEDVVEYTGQIPLLNWMGGVTRGTGAGKSVWNSYDLRWYSVGGVGGSNDEVRYSRDEGVSWTSMSPTALTLKAVDIDAAPDGVVVVGYASGTKVTRWDGSTWSDIVVFSGSAANAAVVYDPVNELWCVAGEASGQQVYTSPDGTTWTSRTPALAGGSTPRLWVNKATGRIISTGTASSAVQMATSDDGGVTWTARTAVSPSFGGTLETSRISMACNAEGVWLLAASDNTNHMKVYVSTDDGTTFTLAKDFGELGGCFNFCMANMGELWGLLKYHSTDGFTIVYSVDNGATWRDTGWAPNGAVTGVNTEMCLAASDSGFMLTLALDDAGKAYPSIRVGLPGKIL